MSTFPTAKDDSETVYKRRKKEALINKGSLNSKKKERKKKFRHNNLADNLKG